MPMKKIYSLAFILLSALLVAQEPVAPKKDTSYWKKSGFFGINLSQTALSNWQGGGEDNIALNAIVNLAADRKKGKHVWENKFDGSYGLIKIGSSKIFKKNIDQFLALSKYSINAFGKYWYYTGVADFRSQFAPGYNYAGDSIAGPFASTFMAPGYGQLGLGLEFRPTDYFSCVFAPIAGKLTIVNVQYLADAGAFGVEKAKLDSSGKVVTSGKRIRNEIGGRFILKFKKDILTNVNYDTYLDLFSNYLNNPGNIDVIWNNNITLKVNKFITATLSTRMIYDDDVIIKRDWNKDGKFDNPNDINGPRTQWMTNFGVGFGYKF
jgi:hypothetical protein